jgi:eukaryotic-like serine/threonine-protein kinase
VPLVAGTRLGPYEIVDLLGKGGMGEVYRARDTRLDRLVAVKVSTEQFSERFEREARAVAALNHPHICHLYDVGPNFLVMEYVHGHPVRPADPKTLLDQAVQIADGLVAAHRAGIVHRDLKPANILVTADGQVKILDFGLALVKTDQAGHAETRAAMTDPGTTVGTVGYMSPEQARGTEVDARTDLWSLGVVLYELATGVRPFDGPTTAVVFESVLNKTPVPVRERNPNIPLELEHIIRRLLEKDRETRYQSAADVRADLKRVERDSGSGATVASASPTLPRRRRLRPIAVAAGALLLVGVAGVSLYIRMNAPKRPVTSPDEYVQLTSFTDSATAPALSPDGRMMAFIRGGSFFLSLGQIYVKLLPNGESLRLTNGPEEKYAPVFTPDGSRISYTQVDRNGPVPSWDTWTVPVLGGAPTRLLPNASGLSWIDNQRVVFSEIRGTGIHMGIVMSTTSRADAKAIYFPSHERAMAHFSYPSPDSASALVVEMDRTGTWQPCRLVPLDGSSQGRQVGPPGGCTSAAWAPDGQWMYFSVRVGGVSHLWRQPASDGMPEQISSGTTEEEGVAVAPDGRSLITAVGVSQRAVWIHDGNGDRAVSSEGLAFWPRLSGSRVFYLWARDAAAETTDMRVTDIGTLRSDTVLSDQGIAGGGQLRLGGNYDVSADGRLVAFTLRKPEGESQIWLATIDHSTPPRLIIRGGDQPSFGGSNQIVFRQLEATTNYLAAVNQDGGEIHRLISDPIHEKHGVSPSGEWVVVDAPGRSVTDAQGTVAISLRTGARTLISHDYCPSVWSSDGRVFLASLAGKTLAIPVPPGKSLPDLPSDGLSAGQTTGIAGIHIIDHAQVAPGPDGATYAFVKVDEQRNLFRIPLH